MSAVRNAEKAVQDLSGVELAEFRRWFHEFDGRVWDVQLEADCAASELDQLGDEAIAEHRAGRTRPLQ